MELEGGSQVHPVELCVYSTLSTDLDTIYQSISELRKSQALLILYIRKVRDSLKKENEVLYGVADLRGPIEKLKELTKRVNYLEMNYEMLQQRTSTLNDNAR